MRHRAHSRARADAAEYFLCAAGIYACFLSWGVLQERITTKSYVPTTSAPDDESAAPRSGRFSDFVFLNFCQALAASGVGLLYLFLKRAFSAPHGTRDVANNMSSTSNSKFCRLHVDGNCICIGNSSISCNTSGNNFSKSQNRQQKHDNPATTSANGINRRLLLHMLRLSAYSALASPFGYASLKHIDYPTMLLAKSCKLVPVLLVSVLLHRRKFPPKQYLAVALVTLGVSMFLMQGAQKRSGAGVRGGNSLFGIALLCTNLFLDGLTNASQDEIFRIFRISGLSMMLILNAISSTFMFLYLLVPPGAMHLVYQYIMKALFLQEGATNLHSISSMEPALRFQRALDFVSNHPESRTDIIMFSLCGALGQVFIFHTLARFGSLSLVTITVTRKMMSILLSVVLYRHNISALQWLAVVVVFSGIYIESQAKPNRAVPSDSGSHATHAEETTGSPLSASSASATDFARLKSSTAIVDLNSSGSSVSGRSHVAPTAMVATINRRRPHRS